MKYIRKDIRATSHKILGYLIDHPDAKDTLEGIADWWMLQQDIKRNVAHIRKTVDELTVKGLYSNGSAVSKKILSSESKKVSGNLGTR